MSMMTAQEVFTALRGHAGGAVIPEVVMGVPEYHELKDLDPRIRPYRRIDGLGFDTLMRTAFEIKVSLPDLKREHPYKWLPWSRVTHRFIYVIPAGLCTQADVVHATGNYSAGVWAVHAGGRIEVLRKAKIDKTPEPLPQQVVQAMAYRLHKLDSTLSQDNDDQEDPSWDTPFTKK